MDSIMYKSHDEVSVDCINDAEQQEILYVEKIMKEWGKDIAVIVLSPEISVDEDLERKKMIQRRSITTYTFHKRKETKK